MSRYLPKNTKTGDFNTQRTLSGSFFVIPERLASIRVVGLAFTANKQTNKQTLSIIYIYIDIDVRRCVCGHSKQSHPIGCFQCATSGSEVKNA